MNQRLCILASLLGVSALAEGNPEIEKHLTTQLQTMRNAVENGADEGSSTLKAFHINVNPYVAFGVDGFAEVEISPEVQFIFEREEATHEQ